MSREPVGEAPEGRVRREARDAWAKGEEEEEERQAGRGRKRTEGPNAVTSRCLPRVYVIENPESDL